MAEGIVPISKSARQMSLSSNVDLRAVLDSRRLAICWYTIAVEPLCGRTPESACGLTPKGVWLKFCAHFVCNLYYLP